MGKISALALSEVEQHCLALESVFRRLDGQDPAKLWDGSYRHRSMILAQMKLDEARLWVMEHLRLEAQLETAAAAGWLPAQTETQGAPEPKAPPEPDDELWPEWLIIKACNSGLSKLDRGYDNPLPEGYYSFKLRQKGEVRRVLRKIAA